VRRGVLPLLAARLENWEEKINILRKKNYILQSTIFKLLTRLQGNSVNV
jgi:hypothetical protein